MKNKDNVVVDRLINSRQVSLFAASLTSWLRTEFCYKRAVADLAWANTVCVRQSRVDLYIRYPFKNRQSDFPDTALVIARMAFKEQRFGHGRSLLQFLLSVQQEHGFKYVAIECAGTPSIHEFAKKFGFEELPHESRSSDFLTTLESLSANMIAK